MHESSSHFSRYQILKQVGQGQFGRVFCAIDLQGGNLVALKELEQKRFPTHKFLRELHFLASLQHPNIVAFQALEHNATGRYIVMDYCEGGTLRNLMQLKLQLSLAYSLKLIADILAGLEHAHTHNIVHCDLKPENILLSLDSNDWIARLSDFGLARISNKLCFEKLGCAGSPAYMAPEQFYGKYSTASDIYAVGVMLFELTVGYRPFHGSPKDLMFAHLNQSVKIPGAIPLLVRSVIATAMQKLPVRRFATATEMLKAIRLAAEVEESRQDSISITSDSSLDVC